jgi:pyruvoyl-dependent arginine decarboxylase (PvlArgDC)
VVVEEPAVNVAKEMVKMAVEREVKVKAVHKKANVKAVDWEDKIEKDRK